MVRATNRVSRVRVGVRVRLGVRVRVRVRVRARFRFRVRVRVRVRVGAAHRKAAAVHGACVGDSHLAHLVRGRVRVRGLGLTGLS